MKLHLYKIDALQARGHDYPLRNKFKKSLVYDLGRLGYCRGGIYQQTQLVDHKRKNLGKRCGHKPRGPALINVNSEMIIMIFFMQTMSRPNNGLLKVVVHEE